MDRIAKNIVPIRIQDEMRNSYMDYSMSVIIGRALPDVRDGLKPVHRRILYAMHQMGLSPSKKYMKCAGVVGEVLKLYHPHGDSAVYDALVRMAQPWNLRYMLVDGQGNFGSVDGDPAAAYRYTECKMQRLAEELLVDIDKETVGFIDNFDGSTQEPAVLPSRFPNLLVNGADGIAVGMATKIPPHNLGEIIDACTALIDDPDLDTEELLRIVPGPDFPTGGTIYGMKGVRDAYTTGRGRVIVRGNTHFEDISSGRQSIIVDELPYQVNKARLIQQIADLVREKRLEGISALRDESDRSGMRIVMELKRDAYAEVVLNNLYKQTSLQSTFGVILLSIVNQRPRILTLKEMIQYYISHRRDVIQRRTRYQLRKARERAHIVEGYLKALDFIDEVISIIRASDTVSIAKAALIERFEFSQIQADAILEMRLSRLTGLERQKLLDEHAELMERITYFELILGDDVVLMGVVKTELIEVRDKYADERRTLFVESSADLDKRDLVAAEDQVVTVSHLGYIKRTSPGEWRMQARGGSGKRGMSTRDEDFVTTLMVANTHDLLLVFTSEGRVIPLHVYDVPEAGGSARGRPIINLVPLRDAERIATILSVSDFEERLERDEDGEAPEGVPDLIFVTRQGRVKRTNLWAYRNMRQSGLIATGIREGDELVLVHLCEDTTDHVLLLSKKGMAIRFAVEDVRRQGRPASGVMGIDLAKDDVLVDGRLLPAELIDTSADDDEPEEVDESDDAEEPDVDPTTLLFATERGYGKRVRFGAFRLQKRYGKGLRAVPVSAKIGGIVGATRVTRDDQVMCVTDTGRIIRFHAGSVSLRSRYARGVRLMRLDEEEVLVDLARLEDAEEDADSIVEEGAVVADADESAEAPVVESDTGSDSDEG
ncbi:MAG: DNA gyrase subunit A [Myxococcota bacterium]